jgi:hypothetical protein
MVQVVQIDARILERYFALRIPRIDRQLLAPTIFNTKSVKIFLFECLEPAQPGSIAAFGRSAPLAGAAAGAKPEAATRPIKPNLPGCLT